jgi:hypothetical protein
MIQNCFNPECKAVVDASQTNSLYCPTCLAENEKKKKESPLAAPEAYFAQCIAPECGKTFECTGRSYFCPDCEKAQAANPTKTTGSFVRICVTPECKQVFHGAENSFLCPLCERIQEKAEQETEESIYSKVKDYLLEHPYATVDEIHVCTKVSINKIKRLLEDGKFQLVLLPKCKQCNGPIPNCRPGQDMCVNCVQKMREQLGLPLTAPVTPASSSLGGGRSDSSKNRKYGFGRG